MTFKKVLTTLFFISLSIPLWAADVYSENPAPAAAAAAEDATAKYLKSLGDYLGYDLTQDVSPAGEAMLDYTLNVVAATSTGQNLLYALLRAIPINATFATFLNGTPYDGFNGQTTNMLFQDFTTANSNTSISATEKFDQQTWQKDPVTQAILNIVGTPSPDICQDGLESTTTSSSSSSNCVSSFKVMSTVLSNVMTKDGQLPGEYDFTNYNSNTSQFISQLNSDNLIGPMLYSSSGATAKGFPSGSQLQQAQAFIRYATEGVLPLPLMSVSDYSKLRSVAYPPTDASGNTDPNIDVNNANQARLALASYLLNLRVYAAKSSVAISNLYAILGKRMQQSNGESSGSGSNNNTSEAVNEFQMATWRLYNPQTQQSSDQWAQKISNASPASIQKEMAILLSEINYQLYLNRQQQERLLLTNSMILMELLSAHKPSPDFPATVSTDTSKADTTESS